jgi:predicted metal-dependent phosphoesterase TrpH
MDEVTAFAGEGIVGRPHFAQAMVAKGYARAKDEAFARYLGKGKPAYVDRFRLGPREAIARIHEAGGLAVLAHPGTLGLAPDALRRAVAELKGWGLDGLEAYYSEHPPAVTAGLLALARETGLVATGGSDFHGAMNPDIRLGRGFGRLSVPDSVVDELRARLSADAVAGGPTR